jgi:hypothetical protein
MQKISKWRTVLPYSPYNGSQFFDCTDDTRSRWIIQEVSLSFKHLSSREKKPGNRMYGMDRMHGGLDFLDRLLYAQLERSVQPCT